MEGLDRDDDGQNGSVTISQMFRFEIDVVSLFVWICSLSPSPNLFIPR